jgi:hypothetical protein
MNRLHYAEGVDAMPEHAGMLARTERVDSPIYGEIMPIAAIQQNIARVQLLKQEVLREGVDFGVIPGTPKPSLYKPGAEIVNLMFGVSVDPDPLAFREEEGVDDTGRPFYRVTVRQVFKTRTGLFLGASYGSASSLEEKYKWRRATGPKEFAATVEGWKRSKFKRGKNNTEYEEPQVRTEVDDIRNTILQMAMKRSEVSGTKRVHALSGMFGQDLEDLPAEIRDSIVDGEVVSREASAPPPPAAHRKSQQHGQAPGDAPPPREDTGKQPSAPPPPAATRSTVTVVIEDTQVVPRADSTYYEIKAMQVGGDERLPPTTHVFLTGDEDLYKVAASCEGSGVVMVATWHPGKRRDGSVGKMLDELTAAD